jgi:hypothetical protein
MRQLPTVAWFGIAAAAAMIVGSFGPWAKVLFASVSGTDGANDGWLVVIAALIGGACFILYSRRPGLLLPLVAAIAGGAGTVVTIYDRRNLTSADDGSEFTGFVQVGWGMNLAMSASVALVGVGVFAFVLQGQMRGWRRSGSAPSPPPLPPAAPSS